MRDFADPPTYAFQDCPRTTFSPAYNETYRTNHGPDANSSSFFCWKTTDNCYDTNYDTSDAQCSSSNWLSDNTAGSAVDVFTELGLLEFYAPIKIKGESITSDDCKINESIDAVSMNQPQQPQPQQQQPTANNDQQSSSIDMNRSSINETTRNLFPSFPSFDDNLKETTFVDTVVNNTGETFYTSYSRLNETCNAVDNQMTNTGDGSGNNTNTNNSNNFHLNIDECIQLDNMVVTDCDANTYDGEMSDCLNWLTYNETNTRQCKWAGCTMTFHSQESLVSFFPVNCRVFLFFALSLSLPLSLSLFRHRAS